MARTKKIAKEQIDIYDRWREDKEAEIIEINEDSSIAELDETQNIEITNIQGQTITNLVGEEGVNSFELKEVFDDTIIDGYKEIINPSAEKVELLNIEGETYQNLIADGDKEELLRDVFTWDVMQGEANYSVVSDNVIDIDEIQGQTYQNLITGGDKETILADVRDIKLLNGNSIIENTIENGQLKLVDVGGNTWQDDKSGKNMFNVDGSINEYYSNMTVNSSTNVVENGILKTNAYNVRTNGKGLKILLEANTNYVISAKKYGNTDGEMAINFPNANNHSWFKNDSNGTYSKIFNSGANTEMILSFKTSVENQFAQFEKIQVEKGNIASSFEPFKPIDLSNIQHLGKLHVNAEGNPILDNLGREQYEVEIEQDGYSRKKATFANYLSKSSFNNDEYGVVSFGHYMPTEVYINIVASINFEKAKDGYFVAFTQGGDISISFNSITKSLQFKNKNENCNLGEIKNNEMFVFTLRIYNDKKFIIHFNGINVFESQFDKMPFESTDILTFNSCFFGSYSKGCSGISLYLAQAQKNTINNKSIDDNDWNSMNVKYKKQTILLPCQLMKVGDIADRLYWDNVKGRYVIDKNVANANLSQDISDLTLNMAYSHTTSVYGFEFNLPYKNFKDWDAYNYITNIHAMKGIHITTVTDTSFHLFNSSKFRSTVNTNLCDDTVESYRDFLQRNNVLLFYCKQSPQLIETNIVSPIILSTYAQQSCITIGNNVLSSEINLSNNILEHNVITLLPNTEYTLIADTDKSIAIKDISYDLGGTTGVISTTSGYKYTTQLIKTPMTLIHNQLILTGEGNKIKNIMVLKGKGQERLDYFEKVTSFGERSPNLLDMSNESLVIGYLGCSKNGDNPWSVKVNNARDSFIKTNIKLENGETYIFKADIEFNLNQTMVTSYIPAIGSYTGDWSGRTGVRINQNISEIVVPNDGKAYCLVLSPTNNISGNIGTVTYSNIGLYETKNVPSTHKPYGKYRIEVETNNGPYKSFKPALDDKDRLYLEDSKGIVYFCSDTDKAIEVAVYVEGALNGNKFNVSRTRTQNIYMNYYQGIRVVPTDRVNYGDVDFYISTDKDQNGEDLKKIKRSKKEFWLNEPLRRIGTTTDKFYYDSQKDKYCVERRISKIDIGLQDATLKKAGDNRLIVCPTATEVLNSTSKFLINNKDYNLITNVDSNGGTTYVYITVDMQVANTMGLTTIEQVAEYLKNTEGDYLIYHTIPPIIEELEYTNERLNTYSPTSYVKTNSIAKPSIMKLESKATYYNYELTPSTKYTILFNATKNRSAVNNIIVNLGGMVDTTIAPLNDIFWAYKLTLTTPTTLSNNKKLSFSANNMKIKNVMLLQEEKGQFPEYFDRMCSAGQLYVDDSGTPILDSKGNNQYKTDLLLRNKNVATIQNYNVTDYGITRTFTDGMLSISGLTTIGYFGFFVSNGEYSRAVTTNVPENLRKKCFIDEPGEYVISFKYKGVWQQMYTRMNVWYDNEMANHYSLPISNSGKDEFTEYSVKINVKKRVNDIHFQSWYDNNKYDLQIKDIQIEKGTTKTDYIKPELLKQTILLPCQLEKVGNQSDILYWDTNKSKYCVEKRIKKEVFKDSNYSFKIGSIESSWNGVQVNYERPTAMKQTKPLFSKIISVLNSDLHGAGLVKYDSTFGGFTNDNYIRFIVKNAKTIQQAREMIDNLNVDFYYALEIPEIIETEIDIPYLLHLPRQIANVSIDGGIINPSSTSIGNIIREIRIPTIKANCDYTVQFDIDKNITVDNNSVEVQLGGGSTFNTLKEGQTRDSITVTTLNSTDNALKILSKDGYAKRVMLFEGTNVRELDYFIGEQKCGVYDDKTKDYNYDIYTYRGEDKIQTSEFINPLNNNTNCRIVIDEILGNSVGNTHVGRYRNNHCLSEEVVVGIVDKYSGDLLVGGTYDNFRTVNMFMPIMPNTIYTPTCYTSQETLPIRIYVFDENKKIIQDTNGGTFTTTKDARYFKLSVDFRNNLNLVATAKYMINEGPSPMEYEKYYEGYYIGIEDVYHIFLSKPLRSNGDIRDRVFLNGKDLIVERRLTDSLEEQSSAYEILNTYMPLGNLSLNKAVNSNFEIVTNTPPIVKATKLNNFDNVVIKMPIALSTDDCFYWDAEKGFYCISNSNGLTELPVYNTKISLTVPKEV